MGAEQVGDPPRIALLYVVLVEPVQFVGIEVGSRFVDLIDIEQLDHLVQGEYLLVAV